MKTKNTLSVRQLVLAALFLALAFVLPLLTGQVPKVGNMLCPMHFPVLLCGFVCGAPWGAPKCFVWDSVGIPFEILSGNLSAALSAKPKAFFA